MLGGPLNVYGSNFTFEQNFLVNCISIIINASSTNDMIRNNAIQGTDFEIVDGTGVHQVYNNIMKQNTNHGGNYFICRCNFFNNIIESGTLTVRNTNNTLVYNNLSYTTLPAGTGNIFNVPMPTVFTYTGSTENSYRLLINSPAIGSGVGGQDMGIYGGVRPYVLSGIPNIPTITSFSGVGHGTPASGLPVTVRATARN